MRCTALVCLLALAALSGGTGDAAAPVEQLVFVRDGDLWTAAADGARAARLTRSTASESNPTLAPDGLRIAYASNRSGDNEIYLARSDGAGALPLTGNPRRNDASPAWSPDGRRLAWASQGDVYVMNDDGTAKHPLAATAAEEVDPVWSPTGREIAYTAGGDLYVVPAVGGAPRALTSGPPLDGHADWSARSGIAFVRDGAIHVVPTAGGQPRRVSAGPLDSAPSWAPGGRLLVFARATPSGSDLYAVRADGRDTRPLIAGGGDPDWGVLATPEPAQPLDELLPDLDQRAPTGLTVSSARGRFKVGFISATDNVGRGPVWIVASRRSARGDMRARQLVALRGGGARTYRGAGVVRYVRSSSHSHWHYLRFMRYELRRERDFGLVVRDNKSGFCLADHYGLAARRVRIARPRFLDNCEKGRPDAVRVTQGTSVGYTDRYPAHYHGQNVDVTDVPPGRYWLVHRTNPFKGLRELRYGNNAAAVLLRLAWPQGRRARPSVRVVRVCEGSERCGLGL